MDKWIDDGQTNEERDKMDGQCMNGLPERLTNGLIDR